jgi:hypothetical protein
MGRSFIGQLHQSLPDSKPELGLLDASTGPTVLKSRHQDVQTGARPSVAQRTLHYRVHESFGIFIRANMKKIKQERGINKGISKE